MTVTGRTQKGPLITHFRMSDRIQNKIEELGLTWEEVTPEVIEFLDNKYRSPSDGIVIEDNENPKISKKMKFYQTDDGLALIRIRMNRMNRLADNDKIRFRVIIGDAIPDMIKVKISFKYKPMKQVKICKVNMFLFESQKLSDINMNIQRHSTQWRTSKFALYEDERGDEAKYESVRGGHVAIFDKLAVRSRDDFEIAVS